MMNVKASELVQEIREGQYRGFTAHWEFEHCHTACVELVEKHAADLMAENDRLKGALSTAYDFVGEFINADDWNEALGKQAEDTLGVIVNALNSPINPPKS